MEWMKIHTSFWKSHLNQIHDSGWVPPEFGIKQYWKTADHQGSPLTFNQLSQQGRLAGMHESWQRQACSAARSEISPLKYSGSSLTFQPSETSTRLTQGWDAAEEQWHAIKGCNYAI